MNKGEYKMKRTILAVLSIIMALSVSLIGTVSAANEGYGFSIGSGVPPSIDGEVGIDEWNTDSYKDFLYDGWTMTTNFFRCKWSPLANEYFLTEALSDITNDAGDIFQLTYDGGRDGGATPNANDFKIQLTGHTVTTGVQVFAGTGTAWGTSAAVRGTDYEIATSMSSGHWVIELWINKNGVLSLMASGNNLRLSAYDASTAQTLMWPPESSADVPDTWGTGTSFVTTIPEGLTIAAMALTSLFAVVAGTRYFSKRAKCEN